VSRRRAPALAAAVTALACGAADTPVLQIARGADVYARECRHCHDVAGGIGVVLSDRVIGAYETAQRLFAYLRVAMPYGAPGSLEERVYWDLVAYLASSGGARPLPVVIDSTTAARVLLTEEPPAGR